MDGNRTYLDATINGKSHRSSVVLQPDAVILFTKVRSALNLWPLKKQQKCCNVVTEKMKIQYIFMRLKLFGSFLLRLVVLIRKFCSQACRAYSEVSFSGLSCFLHFSFTPGSFSRQTDGDHSRP